MPSQDSGTLQRGIRVVVLGATGNVGTSVVATLAEDARVASILGGPPAAAVERAQD